MKEKRCGKCGLEKPFDDFHRSNRGDGFQRWCKPCRKEYDRAYHARTRLRRVALARARHQKLIDWHRKLKSETACADCGQSFHHAAITWDHLPGSVKIAEVSILVRANTPRKVKTEIAKCELVCANCHAVRSYERQHGT